MSTTLGDAFDAFGKDASRIEVLPAFNMPEELEAFQASIAGQQPDLSFLSGWHDHLRGATQAGKTHRRLRVVSDPPTDYELFELKWGYPSNAVHGEQIRVTSRNDVRADLRDIWIFDGGDAAFEVLYDDSGSFLGSRELSTDETREITSWFDATWSSAPDFSSLT